MTDIVERLRLRCMHDGCRDIQNEAADEIERLRAGQDWQRREIERLRELFRIDGEQHAIHVREIEARHELRHKHYCTEIERLKEALTVERERCATVALEQRCERGTPWDLACTTIAAAVRREK